MAEATATAGEGSPTPAAPATPTPAATTTGTEPAKPASSSQAIDPTKLSDEDFQKIFEDPRAFTQAFNHPRFKALNDRAKEADELKAKAEKDENARLEGQKKYQELAQKHEASATEWKGKFETSSINNAITAEAIKLGITDIDAATKLIDRSGISIDDNGSVNGVEAAVKALAESKTYLVDKSKGVPTIGSPTNPANSNQSQGAVKQFRASEIANPTFYKEHAAEIDASIRANVPIIDDRGQA